MTKQSPDAAAQEKSAVVAVRPPWWQRAWARVWNEDTKPRWRRVGAGAAAAGAVAAGTVAYLYSKQNSDDQSDSDEHGDFTDFSDFLQPDFVVETSYEDDSVNEEVSYVDGVAPEAEAVETDTNTGAETFRSASQGERVVRSHTKNQAYGPRWSQHRPINIDEYTYGGNGDSDTDGHDEE